LAFLAEGRQGLEIRGEASLAIAGTMYSTSPSGTASDSLAGGARGIGRRLFAAISNIVIG
jgi:hypothetical protein